MYKHILIPLDGSQLAETALPVAVYIAKTFHARVTLLHLIEKDAPVEIHGDAHLHEESEACAYLDKTRLTFPGDLNVECHVHTATVEDVAKSLVAHAAELNVDMIVMCTHGRGGLRSWLVGSIAQQVVNQGSTPVLLVKPIPDTEIKPFNCKKILVPLDGDPAHEQSMAAATIFAKTCQADLNLLLVVYTPDKLPAEKAATFQLLPGAATAVLEFQEEAAREYLHEQIVGLPKGLSKPVITVEKGDPPKKIVDVAKRTMADLIIIGTHGKAGADAFWSRSITPKIINSCDIPILLVPVK